MQIGTLLNTFCYKRKITDSACRLNKAPNNDCKISAKLGRFWDNYTKKVADTVFSGCWVKEPGE